MKLFSILTAALVLVTGCQNEQTAVPEASTGVEATLVAFNTVGAPTASLYVPEMFCEQSCVVKVKQILAEQTGVKEVKVDFETKVATVAIDETEFNAEAAIAALVDYQFTDSKLVVHQDISEAAPLNVPLN